MLNRQIERYKNSLHEVEIIVAKYDMINQKEHEKNLRDMISNIKEEVKAVQNEPVLKPPQITENVEQERPPKLIVKQEVQNETEEQEEESLELNKVI